MSNFSFERSPRKRINAPRKPTSNFHHYNPSLAFQGSQTKQVPLDHSNLFYNMRVFAVLAALSSLSSVALAGPWTVSFYTSDDCTTGSVDSEGDSKAYGCTNLGSKEKLNSVQVDGVDGWWVHVFPYEDCGGDSTANKIVQDEKCHTPTGMYGAGAGDMLTNGFKSYKVIKA
ncbi:unnamed protein product [Penicillium salamii]|uniref:Uncharacterized protein n=1 Tax=Penicillium salamii TaxID=1612424 RepID=A0A9W4IBV8_9EURO|nr:unnamed protein product [Penicillium salamii]